ncbi:MAG: pilus assembly protein PilM [Caldicoprobacterales bacterium]
MVLFRKIAVGIEIDDKEIRAVLLQKKKDNIYLTGYDRISLAPSTVEDGVVSKTKELENYIKTLWGKNKFGKKNIFLGLSNQDVMIRKVSFPNIPKEKLDLLVSNHAQEYIPFSLDNCVLDYMIVGEKETEDVKQVEVLLAVAQLPMIKDFYECFNNNGLKIQDIKIASLSLLDVVKESETKGVVIFVDIANNLANLVISIDGSPKLIKSI